MGLLHGCYGYGLRAAAVVTLVSLATALDLNHIKNLLHLKNLLLTRFNGQETGGVPCFKTCAHGLHTTTFKKKRWQYLLWVRTQSFLKR